jgi:hypothetical protein
MNIWSTNLSKAFEKMNYFVLLLELMERKLSNELIIISSNGFAVLGHMLTVTILISLLFVDIWCQAG